MYYKVVGKYKK